MFVQMSSLVRDCFDSKVKAIPSVVLQSCFYRSAVSKTMQNKLWVVYSMRDSDFFGSHVWQLEKPIQPEVVVYEVRLFSTGELGLKGTGWSSANELK